MEPTQSFPYKRQLIDLFPSDDVHLFNELQYLLTLLENHNSSFVVCAKVTEMDFLYMSPSIRDLTGFDSDRFIGKEGLRFFYERTPAPYLKEIQTRQTDYLLESRKPGFNFYSPQLMRFDGALLTVHNGIILIRIEFVTLSYTEDGNIDLILGRGINSTNFSAHALEEEATNLRQTLYRIKELYVKLYPEQFERIQQKLPVLQSAYFSADTSCREITNREKEVLLYLGNGLSSKEIACELNISFNTIETHRKKLLEKFEARNSAELIKKASKVFWL